MFTKFTTLSLGQVKIIAALIFVSSIVVAGATRSTASPAQFFKITIVDSTTGRGVPLVELRTVNHIRYYSDSNGVVAINDPDLMGHSIYFHVSSPGYIYPKDSFGYRGLALKVLPGKSVAIKIKRLNIAQRLYRMTGGGIYRDSILTGQPTPLKHPLLDGKVMGQDTVEVTPYHGKIYWFFGDTQRPSYPLGQFATSGATSSLPAHGGLDPSLGVNLVYWVGSDGFSRPMIKINNPPGPVWVGGLFTLKVDGQTHLFTNFVEVRHDQSIAEDGLAEFDDKAAVFVPVFWYPAGDGLRPEGHPFEAIDHGKLYLYFEPTVMGAFPIVRVPADLADVENPKSYESYTCLLPGTRYHGSKTKLQRSSTGELIWGWKKDTMALGEDQANKLIAAGLMQAEERVMCLHDVATNSEVLSHGGSVFWNSYLHRWIMITTQAFGSPSFLGEVWFAEADTPVGPWAYAAKIATHGGYTFYNPTQLPFFDQKNGKLIYFQGTYTNTYSNVTDITPRYNYNQLMYSLNLADPRLTLPVPVYYVSNSRGQMEYAQRPEMEQGKLWNSVKSIPFYAMPRNNVPQSLIPIYAIRQHTPTGFTEILQTSKPTKNSVPLFYALPATYKAGSTTTPLYEFTSVRTGRRWYATAVAPAKQGVTRSPEPICVVWKNPTDCLALNGYAHEVKMP